MNKSSLAPLRKALESVTIAIKSPPANDLERDGAIQRFEYTFELAWKTAKRFLASEGVESLSPKSVIRDMGQQKWIEKVDLWLQFLDARNQTAHIYRKEIAERVYEVIQDFTTETKHLLKKLETL